MAAINLPVAKVTVLEDRAQVERRGALELPAGRSVLRVEAVSTVIVDRSLKASVDGAKVVEARVLRAFKPVPPGGLPADASELRRRIRELEQRLSDQQAQNGRHAAELEVVRAARADLLRAIGELTATGSASPDAWRQQLEQLRAAEARVEGAVSEGLAAQQRAEVALAEARAARGVAESPPEALEAAIELTVEVPAASPRAEARISYLVPCAAWRPRYRATLRRAGAGASVELETEASVWQRTGEAWGEAELSLSTARPTLGLAPPELTDDFLSTRPKSAEEKRTVDVSVREEIIQTVGAGAAAEASELPGIDDAGEVQVLAAPGKVTIPSDGQPHRVRLSSFQAPATTQLLCAPEQSPLVSLVATFRNDARAVLLAGPVDLVRESGFVGRSQLRFAARGDEVKLSFGSEDHLRVAREETRRDEESRLTGRRTIQRAVQLFVSNAGGQPVRLSLEERIPVSEVKEVEVSLRSKDTQPSPAEVTRDGIVRFALDLPAREHREVKLAYDVSAAAKVVGI